MELWRRARRHRACAAAGEMDCWRRHAGGLHHPAKAKRVVQLFMSGAASQCDTFDYKPQLIRAQRAEVRSGRQGGAVSEQPRRGDEEPLGLEAARAMRASGSAIWCRTWPRCVDDMAFVHSMISKSNVHGPATFMQNTGFVLPGFRAWAPGSPMGWAA